MEVYRRWAQRDLAVKLPPEAQWRCLPPRSKVLRKGSSLSRIDLVDVQGEEGHAEAAECDEQVLSGEGHDSHYRTLLTNVTAAQGCVVKSFRGGCGQSSFFMTYPFGAIKTGLEKAFRLPEAPPLEQPQKQDAAELSESERSTILFEHPDV